MVDLFTESLAKCINTHPESYQKGEFIPILSSNKALIGYISDGDIDLMKSDIEGNWLHIESFHKKDLVSKIWIYNEEKDLFFVCLSPVTIYYFDYLFLLEGCHPSCPRHTEIITFLFDKMILYTTKLNQKLTILQKRNMEDKIMAYFKLLSKNLNQKKFELPISYKELADFLAVDRSALMRKLNDLNNEHKIKRIGKTIILYNEKS